MIYCRVGDLAKINKAFEKVVEFLKSPKEVGTYEIDGDKIYARVMKNVTKKVENSKVETHIKYIDVQFLYEGHEKVGFGFVDETSPKEVNEEKDTILYDRCKDENFVELKEDFVVVLFPEDAHRPGICINEPTQGLKAVIKISTDLL